MWCLPLDFLNNKIKEPLWSRVTYLSTGHELGALAHHTAVTFGSCAYFFGGIKANGSSNLDMFMFEIKDKKWVPIAQKGDLPGSRENHTC